MSDTLTPSTAQNSVSHPLFQGPANHGAPFFSRESIAACWDEARELILANQRETGAFDSADFDPNPEFYFHQEATGKLVLFTMREAGKLVGYQVFALLTHHPRYLERKNLALQDVLYVSPDYRGPSVAVFIRFADGELEREGWRPIRHSSARRDVGSLYEHLGYDLLEKTYIKRELA